MIRIRGNSCVHDCDVLFVLSSLAQLRGTPVGDYNHAIRQLELIRDGQSKPFHTKCGDLLLIDLGLVRELLSSNAEEQLSCISGIVNSVNFLLGAGWTSQPVFRPERSSSILFKTHQCLFL